MTTRVLAFASALALAACAPGAPEAIAYDADGCAYCHMQISDKRFGAVLVTKHGRTVKFDSIECLLDYYHQAANANDVASVWVSDVRHPGSMLDAHFARFVDLGTGHSPMGRTHGWAALATARDAAAIGFIDSTMIKRWGELP